MKLTLTLARVSFIYFPSWRGDRIDLLAYEDVFSCLSCRQRDRLSSPAKADLILKWILDNPDVSVIFLSGDVHCDPVYSRFQTVLGLYFAFRLEEGLEHTEFRPALRWLIWLAFAAAVITYMRFSFHVPTNFFIVAP